MDLVYAILTGNTDTTNILMEIIEIKANNIVDLTFYNRMHPAAQVRMTADFGLDH